MNDSEQPNKIEQSPGFDTPGTELYRAVEEFLNNFGKENALYPTRSYIQVESEELKKLAQVFYSQRT